MSNAADDLENLWKNEEASPVDPELRQAVENQARRWYLLLGLEIVGIAIGIVAPLIAVIRNPDPFWVLWALDLWGVVGISSWFLIAKVKDMLIEIDQSTLAYERALRRRFQLQIKASNAGVILASLQFLILPLLGWWQISQDNAVPSELFYTYTSILVVMAIYIGVMLRVKSRSQRSIAIRGSQFST